MPSFNPGTASRSDLINRLETIVNGTDPNDWKVQPDTPNDWKSAGCLGQRLLLTNATSRDQYKEINSELGIGEYERVIAASERHSKEQALRVIEALRKARPLKSGVAPRLLAA